MDLPVRVREIENLWIPLSDGTRLAARVWLPESAERAPVPAILEYLPYRKRDFMRLRDEPMHRYYAGHGYAAIRVDLRGTGDSDGVLHDEYLPQEQADALEVLRWLAAQPWCTGRVGMTGISWGGFNALQVAAHAPAELAAIITLCASDDRYADDAHYMGGCVLNENQIWGTVLFSLNGLPPDPRLVGERWREMWLERLRANAPFPARWLRHQHRDAYWRQGSVCEDFSRIRCPVYAIGGWADGYSNAVGRLLEGLSVPRKGLLGPWAHTFPHNGVPGPAVGYLQEALRWWDHWLKGIDTGIMDEPVLRAWMQESVPPAPFHAQRPGRWVAEAHWPSSRIAPYRLQLTAGGRLVGEDEANPDTAPQAPLSIASPLGIGAAAGPWCGFGDEGEGPRDQRGDDGRSLVFETEPLAARLELLGTPALALELGSDRPVAQIAARLGDVQPDGAVALVTYGLLNLTHRDGHAAPRPLVPGERYRVRLVLNDIGHVFPAGNRIRVALSTSYWPLAWPAPERATLSLFPTECCLLLPRRPPGELDEGLTQFEPPAAAPATSTQAPLRPPHLVRTVARDLLTNDVVHRMVSEGGDLDSARVRIDDIDLELGHTVERHFVIDEEEPGSARAEVIERLRLGREGWRIRVDATTTLTSDRERFRVVGRLVAREGDAVAFDCRYDEEIPRELV